MRAKIFVKDLFYQTVPTPMARYFLPALPGSTPFTPEVMARQVIFIHVPKAAGTSIRTALYDGKGGGHRRLAEYYGYDPKLAQAFFKFGFVRNPWGRLLSAYNYLLKGPGATRRDRGFAASYLADISDFSAFVSALEGARYRRAVFCYDHFQPQAYWVCRPGQQKHGLDFLGRFESYASDIEQLNTEFGLTLDAQVRKRDSGTGGDYRDAYTHKTRQIVADLYAQDVAQFGYSF